MDIDYFLLLSDEPIELTHVGNVQAHTLRKIRQTYGEYNSNLAILSLCPRVYFEKMRKDKLDWFDDLPQKQKDEMTMWFLIQGDKDLRQLYTKAFEYFLVEGVEYVEELECFLTYKERNEKGDVIPCGAIQKESFDTVIDVILQRYCAKIDKEEEKPKFKNSKARKIWEKMQKGASFFNKCSKNKNYELGNIISAVSAKSTSLNIINIWDITIFQLYDQFQRLQINTIFEMQAHSVSVWGDKNKQFDSTEWFASLKS